MSPFAISQSLVAIAICFDLLSFQFKERPHIIACLIFSCILISCHFAILGHWTATGLGFLATVRFLASLFTTSKKVMGLFMCASVAISIVSYSGILSILSCLGSLFGTAGTFCKDDKRLRQILLIGTSLWLVHNILAKSPTAVLMEALFIASNLVGYYRFYLKRI
ncbi:MAG: YgjV family protein [Desulfoprunum sp.]|nr:YgjV family protein [Desulfoprunum sp.]